MCSFKQIDSWFRICYSLRVSELKYPIELLVYPRESSGSGAYSLARTKNGGARSVRWDYETQKWIKCNLSVEL